MAFECDAFPDFVQSKFYVQLDPVIYSKVFGFFADWKPTELFPSEARGQEIRFIVVYSKS